MDPYNHSGLMASPPRNRYKANITRSHSLTPKYAQSTNTLTSSNAQVEVEVEVEHKAKGNQLDDVMRLFPILSVDNQTTHEIDELQECPHSISQTFPSFTLSNFLQNDDNQSDCQLENGNVEISRKERQRCNSIREIYMTEKVYIRDLCVLHDFYIVPMLKQRHPVMENAQIAVFFSHLTQLITLHRKLFHDLEEMLNHQGITQAPIAAVLPHTTPNQLHCEGIGAVFCRFAGLFMFHAAYAKDYETVMKLLQQYRNDVKLGFDSLLQKCKSASRSSQNFDSLLIMPIQRIPRYKLLLQRVCENTPSEDSDARFLTEAVQRVEEATTKMNATVAAQADLETILATQKLFQGQISLITANRKLIKTGKLVKVSKHQQQPKQVVLHLFNDILLCSDFAGSGGLRLRRIVELVQPTLRIDDELSLCFALSKSALARDGFKQNCAFTITSPQKKVLLVAASPCIRKEWTEQLRGVIHGARLPETKEAAADSNDTGAAVIDGKVKSCTLCKSVISILSEIHRCQRCGFTVCDCCFQQSCVSFTSSDKRDAENQSGTIHEEAFDHLKERMCNRCYQVMETVRKAATIWQSLIIKRRGILRRYGEHDCNEYYFEVRPRVLKQYTLESTSQTTDKECLCTLNLAGVVVIQRATQQSQHCFQIINSSDQAMQKQFDDFTVNDTQSEENTYANRSSSTQYSEVGSFHGDYIPDENARDESKQLSSERDEWILSARNIEEEIDWSNAIQSAADEAAASVRDHQNADKCIQPGYRAPQCIDSSVHPQSKEDKDFESTNIKSPTQNIDTSTLQGDCSQIETGRLDTLQKIIQTEEWYITCLEECVRIYVQPLLLRQLEAQKCLREERQKKTKHLAYASHGGANSSQIETSGSNNGNSTKTPSTANESEHELPLTPSARSKFRGMIGSTIFQHRNHSTGKTPFFLGSTSTSKSKKSTRSGSLNGNGSCVRPQGRAKCKSTSSIREVDQEDSQSSTSFEWKPQLQKPPLLNAAMAVFFSSINHICTLNQQLLNRLSRHVSESIALRTSDHLFRPGAIFNAYTPLFELYIGYAERHDAALAMITSAGFSEFFEEIPEEATEAQLHVFLSMPMRQIPKYQKSLRKLLALTSKDHLDFSALTAAIEYVDQVALRMEAAVISRYNAKQIEKVSLQSGLDLEGRLYVKDGTLRKVGRSRVKKYHVILLEDAIVYGRKRSSMHKKRYQMVDLWECEVSNQTDAAPQIINASGGGNVNAFANAFYFYSPIKSFILLASTQEEKQGWMEYLRICIDRSIAADGWLNVSHRWIASNSEYQQQRLLLDPSEPKAPGLETTLVIKNGWLNVLIAPNYRKGHRYWVSLTMKNLTLSSTFKSAKPEQVIPIAQCDVFALEKDELFSTHVRLAEGEKTQILIFETESLSTRDEWVRTLMHCIGNYASSDTINNVLALRRQSVINSSLAPIFMYDRTSNVCTICYHTFTALWIAHMWTLLASKMESVAKYDQKGLSNMRPMCGNVACEDTILNKRSFISTTLY
uniref:Uncharacterized protein AlNc14C18G1875 n=1 Tax=Albugo laibachii Nc14 TaxID=890382 RepID=F0W4Q3_9STRA|nr:conserved hypothetical protein [Albugo laibachii Nc14]|eukprot:CCA16088.1 conserved hypothetical protein [Albugo laibachii Nc14]